jgi:hypothetical protein
LSRLAWVLGSMGSHRISSTTRQSFDALRADFERVFRVFSGSATNTLSLAAAERQLAGMAAQIKALRLAVRGEIANAMAYERGRDVSGPAAKQSASDRAAEPRG